MSRPAELPTVARLPTIRSTTVLLVRRDGRTCMASDGQVTVGEAVMKSTAVKVKRAGKGRVLVGFAGGGSDALALFTRFEAKLEEHSGNLERAVVELARDWRTDRALRQLQAMMIVADRDQSYLVSGNGDLLQPDASPRGACSPSAREATTRSPPPAPCCGTPPCPPPRWRGKRC